MSTKILVTLLVGPAILLGLLLTADYVVVDVREGGPDGNHFIIPVPLALARAAIVFAPAEAQYVEVPELAPYIDDVIRIVEELRGARDGALVSVEQRDETVLIEKIDENLRIDVQEGADAEVHVTLSLDAVIDILKTYDGEGFYTRDIVRLIGGFDGDMVHVRDGDEEVKVWIW